MLRKLSISVFLLALLGLVILPALAYTVGRFVIGPYAGNDGLLGYLMSLYHALAAGSVGAALFVLAPLGIVVVWWFVGWWVHQRRRRRARGA